MAEENHQTHRKKVLRKSPLDRRLDSVGWGLFLIMIGCLWLIPEGKVPHGTWLIGTGLIIVGLSAVRYFNRIRVSGFWFALGIIALALGISDVFGLNIPVLPILIIIVGLNILIKPLLQKK